MFLTLWSVRFSWTLQDRLSTWPETASYCIWFLVNTFKIFDHQPRFSVGSCQLTVNKCTDSVCQVTVYFRRIYWTMFHPTGPISFQLRLDFSSMTLAQPESTDNKCSDDQFIGESGSFSQRFVGKMWIVDPYHFVLKLVEAPLSRPFAGPTREHTVSFSSDNWVDCLYIGFWLCGEFCYAVSHELRRIATFCPYQNSLIDFITILLYWTLPSVHRHGFVQQLSGRPHRRHFWPILCQVLFGQGENLYLCLCLYFLYFFVCICVCVFKVILGQGGKYDWTRPSVKHYLSTNPTNYTSSTKTWTLPLNQNLNTSLEPKHWHYSSTKTWTLPLSQNIDTTHQPKHWPSLNLNMHSILEHSLT